MTPQERAKATARKLKHRPDLFVKECLGGHLWSKQVGIALSVARSERGDPGQAVLQGVKAPAGLAGGHGRGRGIGR